MTVLKSPNEVDICSDFSETLRGFACCPSIIINTTPFILRSTLVWMINYMITQCEDQGSSEIYGFNAFQFNFVFVICKAGLLVNLSSVWFGQCSFLQIFVTHWLHSEKHNTHGPNSWSLQFSTAHRHQVITYPKHHNSSGEVQNVMIDYKI